MTLVDPTKIQITIKYVQEKIGHPDKWINFWRYFSTTWITRFNPRLWSIHKIDDEQISGRTNNWLERYNRILNEQFANPHPNIFTFLSTLQNEENYYTKLLRNIWLGIVKMNKKFREFKKPSIPKDYVDYKKNLNV